jgi:hypothetical protein
VEPKLNFLEERGRQLLTYEADCSRAATVDIWNLLGELGPFAFLEPGGGGAWVSWTILLVRDPDGGHGMRNASRTVIGGKSNYETTLAPLAYLPFREILAA